MTDPKLAQDSPWGRLYRRPDNPRPVTVTDVEALLMGYLSPSVTNVIDVLNKPFLKVWAARMAAEAAYDMSVKYPDRVAQNYDGAVKYARDASERYRDQTADLGSRVHAVLEALSLGESPVITDEVRPYVTSWENFVNDWQPTWRHVEATMFGNVTTASGKTLGYAGTADGIATFPNGITAILDYKTGKSLNSSSVLQLSALAHAEVMCEDGENMTPVPAIDAGILVHITAKGYKVRPAATLDGFPWETFSALREAWEWHVHEAVRGRNYALLPAIKTYDSLVSRNAGDSAPF